MKLLKTSFEIAARGFTSSFSPLFMPRQACLNAEKQTYKNLCKMKKKEIEDVKKYKNTVHDEHERLKSRLISVEKQLVSFFTILFFNNSLRHKMLL